MSMRDRLRRRKRSETRNAPVAPPLSSSMAPPPSAGPDEETVRIARKDFRRRRNAGRWRRLRLVLLSLLLVAAVSASVWLVFFSSHVAAREVEITGTSTIAAARVERAAAVPTGTPLARIDLGAIRARVESIASVRSAEVSRSWPHAVHISVIERVPVAVIEAGEGLQALDAGGVVFGRYEARPDRLPLVRTEPDLADEALVECGRVIASLPARIAARVQTVEVSSVDKIELVLGSGRRVLWGSAEDSSQKAEVLAVLLRRPGQEIDVSVPGRPTTR